MEKQSNTGWYLLGIVVLLCLAGQYKRKENDTIPSGDNPPDTATSPEIILTTDKT